MRHETIQLYADRTDVRLTTYLIDDTWETLNGKKRPCVIVCPGGSGVGLCDREGEPVAIRFAAMGYHAFVLSYSVYTKGEYGSQPGPEFFRQEHPVREHCLFPAAARDIGAAILEIRKHSDEWLADPKQIVLCGFSAGAFVAAQYAVLWDTELISGHFNKDPEIFRPAAAILGYGIYDYSFVREALICKDAFLKMIYDKIRLAFTGDKELTEALIDQVSPARHISDNTPPMFLWTSSSDELVKPENTVLFALRMMERRRSVELHVYESGRHGISLSSQASASSKEEVFDDVATWMQHAEVWLRRHCPLPLEEKLVLPF